MKKPILILLAVVSGFLVQAASTSINTFDAASEVSTWSLWFGNMFGNVTQPLAWDSTMDAGGTASVGSMRITATTTNSGYDQFTIVTNFTAPLGGAAVYTNLEMDVRFDPASARRTNANSTVDFGQLRLGTTGISGSSQHWFNFAVPVTSNGWVHLSAALSPADADLGVIKGIVIGMDTSQGGNVLNGTIKFWVDNIQLVQRPTNSVSAQCTVHWNTLRQRMDGFGASSAWRSTWSVAQADMLFSTNTGIGLSLLRTRIAPDGTTVEAGIMQLAQARGARVWSATWSPPTTYKDSGTVNGGNFRGGPATNQAYASQLAKYVASMKNTYGINLYAISVQNEPDLNTTGYESCVWSSQQIHDFIPHLSSALIASNVASTKIIIAESEHWKFDLATNSMNDIVTSNQVGILAAHNYGGTAAAVGNYGKPLWETEHSLLSGSDSSMANGIYWAWEIHSFLTVAEVSAWHYWWLIPGNSTGNQGLTDTSGTPAKRMYVLGNYSRFVRPDFFRIGVSNNTGLALISAFKNTNSGSFAIVAANPTFGVITQTVHLSGFTAAQVTPWITSASQSLASNAPVAVVGSAFTYALPPQTVVTFVGGTNSAPTAITLNNTSVAENLPAGTPVGNFSTVDPDAGNTFTYTLVAGAGGTGNALFAISNNTLRTAAFLNRAVQSLPGIRVRSTDQGGLWFEQAFSLTVTPDPQARKVVAASRAADGNLSLTLAGIAGYPYRVQAATSLAPPVLWLTLTNNSDGGTTFIAGTNGLWTHTDLNSTNSTSRFYRTVEP